MSFRQGARQFFERRGIDDSLAVVNTGGAFFDTGITLGDYMALELSFRVPVGASLSGYVLAGYYGGDDSRDFRIFYVSVNGYELVVDVGQYGYMNSRVYFLSASASLGAWHTVLAPAGESAVLDSSFRADLWDDAAWINPSGDYGVAGLTLKLFADSASTPSQTGAIRYVRVLDSTSGEVLHSLWPDRRGGFLDITDGRLILPQSGSVEVKKWREV